MLFWFATATLIAICLSAVRFDLRERRIPNALALSALVAGLALHLLNGTDAVLGAVIAVCSAFAFGLLFYLLGGLGAGDVKLMTGLAAFLGLEGLLTGLAVMATVGVAMALWATWRRGLLGRTFRNLFFVFLTFGKDSFRGWKGEGPMSGLVHQDEGPVRSPYGVAIAIGAIAGWFAPLVGWAI